eukprot:1136261-Pelagomonas_calceolata.AAC.2
MNKAIGAIKALAHRIWLSNMPTSLACMNKAIGAIKALACRIWLSNMPTSLACMDKAKGAIKALACRTLLSDNGESCGDVNKTRCSESPSSQIPQLDSYKHMGLDSCTINKALVHSKMM